MNNGLGEFLVRLALSVFNIGIGTLMVINGIKLSIEGFIK